MNKIEFSCGCKFNTNEHGKIIIPLDTFWDDLNYKCKATWDLISSGNVKCGFQIESSFGMQLAKSIRMDSIDELSDLISISRPGCNDAHMEDGKTLTQHYIMRKNKQEEAAPFHPAIEQYLSKTYQIMVYQEQVSKMVQGVANFTPIEADDLRKAAAKKRSDLMAPLKDKFVEGCKAKGLINEQDSLRIWEWISAGSRYLFCLSHGTAYAYVTYASIYMKTHFPLKTFCNWLSFAHAEPESQIEIAELYNNAKVMGFDIYGPDFRLLNPHFVLNKDCIYFGLSDVHGVGAAAFDKALLLTKQIEESIGSRYSWSYLDLMFRFLYNCSSTVAENLISAGAFDYICSKRTQTKYEYQQIAELKDTAMNWILVNYNKYGSIREVLEACLLYNKFRQPRSKKIVEEILERVVNPNYKLNDTAVYLAGEEKRLLGVSITCSTVDGCDTASANCNCQEYLQGKNGYIIMAVHVDSVKEVDIKNGKNAGKKMAFLDVSDSTCAIQGLPIFADSWKDNKMYLTKGNTVMVGGNRGKTKDKTLIVEKIWQLQLQK